MRIREQKQIERQMGCMAGFLHIFDRHHLLAGKRIYSTKTLPPETDSSPEPDSESTPTPSSPEPEFKEGCNCKFSRDRDRLSVDLDSTSRAKGTLHPTNIQFPTNGERRSTSVVAKLMGLEEPSPAPHSDPQLPRCASESAHAPQYRFFDTKNFQLKHNIHHHQYHKHNDIDNRLSNCRASVRMTEQVQARVRLRGMGQNKSFYDSTDFYPEPKREIERTLKMQGIHDPCKDLKQILNGLFHSNKPTTPPPASGTQSPIVVMKPVSSFNRTRSRSRSRCDSPPPSTSTFRSSPRPLLHNNPAMSPTPETNRNTRAQSKVTPSSPTRNRMTTRKATYQKEDKAVFTEDEASPVSQSSFSNSSRTHIQERFKMEEYEEGRNLLERCDKLLSSIAEITTELQPSPVSVLDSSFCKEDESCSPSPVMKRCIDYKDAAADSEDEMWSSETKWEDSEDLVYVSEIVRASNYFPEDTNVFLLLEKQQHLKGIDTSKLSTLSRRLIFDTIHEILNRNRRLPPWKAVCWADNNTQLLGRIWSDFRGIREREEESEDLSEVICRVLRKDMAEDSIKEWGECPVEMGDVVLDVERLVFKDLIGETIRHLAFFKRPKCNRVCALRRKLVF